MRFQATFLCAACLGILATTTALAQGKQDTDPRPAAATAAGRSDEEKAIRAVDDAFVREYNAGDSKALAARFTEDAEVIEANGDRYQGRELVERSFADTFADAKGAKIAFEIDSIRLLTPDAAKEEGRSVVTPPRSAPVARLYTVLYVKRGGQWLIASVREEADPFVRPHDRLKELDWLVGDWVDEGSESVVHVHCAWSEDKNFLLRSFKVQAQGKPVMNVTQRIGWDPASRHVRSWEFDSEGGFGQGTWSRQGPRWVIKHSGVRPDGSTASATTVMTPERPDRVRWVAADRIIGADAVPDEVTYVLVRVPPSPGGTNPRPAPASNPNPSSPRSPR